jgi:hypothetical protein
MSIVSQFCDIAAIADGKIVVAAWYRSGFVWGGEAIGHGKADRALSGEERHRLLGTRGFTAVRLDWGGLSDWMIDTGKWDVDVGVV